jgi:SOS-response transcriptional repressor LexA
MKSLQDQQRIWLAEKLKNAPRGTRVALATHLGIRPDAISRIVGSKEIRDIKLDDLVGMAEFFNEEPPGLANMRKARAELPAKNYKSHKLTFVPLLDSVTAGRLKSPASQIPVDDMPLLAFADLGRGEWFALKVDEKGDGDSMNLVSPPGSTVVVNKADRDLRNGRFYIFALEGQTTYKMWQDGDPPYLAPYSNNPHHKPIFVKRKRDFEVIGRVKRTILDL